MLPLFILDASFEDVGTRRCSLREAGMVKLDLAYLIPGLHLRKDGVEDFITEICNDQQRSGNGFVWDVPRGSKYWV